MIVIHFQQGLDFGTMADKFFKDDNIENQKLIVFDIDINNRNNRKSSSLMDSKYAKMR